MQVAAEGRGPLLQDGATYDIAVIGAGLAASLFAALAGQKVLLESTSLVGGTTAFSAGSVSCAGHAPLAHSFGQIPKIFMWILRAQAALAEGHGSVSKHVTSGV